MDQQPATRDSRPATPPHCIYLRHPWQAENFEDGVCWSRKFNWPAELPDGEVVQLVVEPVNAAASATLNGQPLGLDGQGRADITRLIDVHNRLSLHCSTSDPSDAEAFPLEVRLEIAAASATHD